MLQVRAGVLHAGGWSDRADRWERYQRSPESSEGSLRSPIEPGLLIWQNKLKICYPLHALTPVAQLKETIAVRHQLLGPQIFFFLPSLNTSSLWCYLLQLRCVSIFSRVLKSNRARGVGFLWDVCCRRHHSQAEGSAILAEELGINTFFFFALKLITLSFQSSPSASPC